MTQKRGWRAVLAVTGAPGLHEAAGSAQLIDVSAPHALAVALEDGTSPVVVATHRVDLAAARTACSLLVGHRPDVPVAVVVSEHAPLTMVGALVTARDTAVDAGHGAAVWRALLGESWSAAVLDSVTRLERPNPRMAQHLRSWLPGSRFVVRQEPVPRAVAAAQVTTLLDGVARGRYDLAVGPAGADDPVTSAVVAAVAPQSVQSHHVPGEWSRLYGRAERFQLALVPSVSSWEVPDPHPPCALCGLAGQGGSCVFCRRLLDAPAPLEAPAPVEAPSLLKAVPA